LTGDAGNLPAMVTDRPKNPANNTPGLWRLAPCAKWAGLDPDTFAQACQLRQIPVEVVEIGPRKFRYVRAQQFIDWMRADRCIDLL
jgi:hypothetical protein